MGRQTALTLLALSESFHFHTLEVFHGASLHRLSPSKLFILFISAQGHRVRSRSDLLHYCSEWFPESERLRLGAAAVASLGHLFAGRDPFWGKFSQPLAQVFGGEDPLLSLEVQWPLLVQA